MYSSCQFVVWPVTVYVNSNLSWCYRWQVITIARRRSEFLRPAQHRLHNLRGAQYLAYDVTVVTDVRCLASDLHQVLAEHAVSREQLGYPVGMILPGQRLRLSRSHMLQYVWIIVIIGVALINSFFPIVIRNTVLVRRAQKGKSLIATLWYRRKGT